MTTLQTPALAAAFQTDPGRVRGNNEDIAMCDPSHGVFAVIDGVGGQAAGEVAAGIARRAIFDRLLRPLGSPAERVREAIALANNDIWKAADEQPEYEGMTCVLTVALVSDRRVTIGHVGDSRCYKLVGSEIRKLTHDHSPVGEREDAREMTEIEAMRHPRRNEVFRDVGGHYRDKDSDDFVEIIEETIEDNAALLLCTDGLSDMVPSSTIEQVVRQHAGNPQAVADALVAAANDAGGKDNVTVVYAEAPEFSHPDDGRGVTLRQAQGPEDGGGVATSAAETRLPSFLDRASWFVSGALAGIGAAVALVWSLGNVATPASRTLVVGDTGATFALVADALREARAGDVVQLEPGEYPEQVDVPDGVDLVARVPGTATFVKANDADRNQEWFAVSAGTGGRISGIRIAASAAAPMTVGIRVHGADRRIEFVEIEGPLKTAIDLTAARGVALFGSRIRNARGPAVAVDGAADVTIGYSTFIRSGPSTEPALSLTGTAPLVTRNLFVGYGNDIVRGLSAEARAQLLAKDAGNVTIAAAPDPPR